MRATIERVSGRELTDVRGDRVPVPDPSRRLHLQFRRFAGCPICNVHLRSVARRHDEIEAAGIREVAVFHSPADELRPYVEDLPFVAIADPDRRLYREFGVQAAPKAILDPRAWPSIVSSVPVETHAVLRRRRPLPPARPHGGRLGLPGDFLIDTDGRVLAHHYGTHADDQWSVDDILSAG